MKTILVKLVPGGSKKFHFGHKGLEINDTIFHSDSLFSALCNNYIRKYGEDGLNEFIDNFPLISSVFYGYEKSGKPILFIPKPIGLRLPNELVQNDRKLPKKVNFMSLDMLAKDVPAEAVFNESMSVMHSFQGTEKIDLYESVADEKIKINRESGTTGEDSLYIVSSIIIKDGVFLYFFIQNADEKTKECIEAIKNFGIGGEITSGYGCIKDIEFMDFDIPDSSEKYINLSLVFPEKEEEKNVESWGLIERRGHVYGTGKLRKTCIGIKEGSVFSKKIIGKILDVSPDDETKAKRYGKAFLLPIRKDILEIRG